MNRRDFLKLFSVFPFLPSVKPAIQNGTVNLSDYSPVAGDWGPAINQVSMDASTVVIDAGVYNIYSPVVLTCNVVADRGATFQIRNGGSVQLGTENDYLRNKLITMPLVHSVKGVTWRDNGIGDDTGVRVVNAKHCRIDIPQVLDFSIGVCIIGTPGRFTAVNEFKLGNINNNAVGLSIRPEGNGWVSENQYHILMIGNNYGREGTRQIELLRGDIPSGASKFWGGSIEADGVEWQLYTEQENNIFMGLRFENDNPAPHVYFGQYSKNNWIIGGTHADKIVRTDIPPSSENTIKAVL